LFDYLSQHPNIFCPANKEPNYFAADFPALMGPATLEDYLQLFAPADASHTAIGEASVLYFYSRVAVAEIRRRYPDAKLIIMIRNPVDMVYSFHSQMVTTVNEEELDFERAWALQDERLEGRHIAEKCVVPEFLQYRDIGRLSRYIRPMLELFPPEQLRLIVFDDLKAEPRKVFDETLDYLGLPPHSDINFRIVNANRVQKSRAVAGVVERPLQPGLARFISVAKSALGVKKVSFRQIVGKWNTHNQQRPPLSPEFRRELVEYFSSEVAELEKLTGRDLQHWLA
jgi:hypothetical protein